MVFARAAALIAVLAVTFAAAVPAGAQQKSIFDDDWVPPKAAPAAAKPTLPPPEPEKPATSTDVPPTPGTTEAPSVVVVPLPLPATRRPVPAPPEQAAVRKVMKELFGPQLADRTPAGRKSLFAALMAQADKSASVPTELFVLLAAAHDAGIGAGDLRLVTRAADDLGRQFEVDALAVKAAAAPTVLRPGSAPKDAVADNVRAALALARAMATAGDYAGAVKIAQAAGPAAVASGDAGLRTQATAAVRDLSALRDAAARITKDLDKLAADPDDPAANLAVGKHWCFDLGSWPAGLAKLAKGSDAALKALAARELAAPKDAEQVASLADAWWEVAVKLPEGLAKANVTAHAGALYERAVNGLTGMKKQLAERRAAQIVAAAGSTAGGTAGRPAAGVVAGARPADRQEMFGSGNNGCTININGRDAIRVTRDKFSQLTVALRAGDVIAVRLPDRPDINSIWITFVSPRGEFLFETSEAWTSYVPADAAKWWDTRTPDLKTKAAAFAPAKQEYVDLVKAAMANSKVARGDLPIRSTLDTGTRHSFVYYVVTREDLLPKTAAKAAGPAPPDAPPPAAGGETFTLPATDTVVRRLKAGTYQVTAHGMWSHTRDGPLRDPDGTGRDELGCLIAKLDRSPKYVFLGKSSELVVPDDRDVQFKIRDATEAMGDNRGSVTVTIRPVK